MSLKLGDDELKKYTGEIGLFIVAIIWGSGFVGTQLAIDSGLRPNQIMAIRFFIATILMSAIFWKNIKDINKSTIKAGMMIGTFLFIGFVFQTYGILFTTPSKNAFITATNVVIVPFIGYILYKRKLDKIGIISSIISLIGIGILSLESDFSVSIGDVLTLICAFGFALHIFFTGEFAKEHDPIALTAVQLGTAFVLSLGLLLITKETNIPISAKGLGAVGYLAVFSTTICFLLQTVCQAKTTQTKTAIILSTEAVFGTIFSIIILKEVVTVKMVVGSILILFGIIMAETKLSFLTKKDKQIEETSIIKEEPLS